jgi:hypothetical protein
MAKAYTEYKPVSADYKQQLLFYFKILRIAETIREKGLLFFKKTGKK